MSFSDRLQLAMTIRGYSQGKLAREVGMAQSSVNKLVNGATGSRKVVEIANILNVRPEWLSYGVGPMNSEESTSCNLTPQESYPPQKNDKDIFRVEVLDIAASAGPGTFLVSDFAETVHAIEFSHDAARRLFCSRPANIIKMITVNGDSMAPTLCAGDQVFVDVSVRNFETDGIYIFIFGHTFHIKRLQMQGMQLAVISDNPAYKEWFISESAEEHLFIMGKVLIHQSIQYNRVG
ncbi:S24 family peptidase [Escherichia coli]|uniref:XRE family transcriptional regulator n=1 Tax=Escherichia coli TaxID=562 RepID=UPI0022AD89A4|nr:S24 family peptidase [Escherichia coli]WRO87668.1 S24 family peptidase [Escherichia coli]HCZ3650537.1 helix-turn-helix transcriptional regulator [Escherichia coli]HDE7214219.1 helix-turn-helix transcriptional regulator [Escherichia coli]